MSDEILVNIRERLSAVKPARSEPLRLLSRLHRVPTRDHVVLVAVFALGMCVLGFTWLRHRPTITQPEVLTRHTAKTPNDAPFGENRREPKPANAATKDTQRKVHVVCAVVAPGVYDLGSNARVEDAVAAAGGALPDADLARVNLAASVQDGQQVCLPRAGEPSPAGVSPGAFGSETPAVVNLNTASRDQLVELPGVGEVTAKKIIDYRERHGPFASVRSLLDVPGIGEAKLAQLEDLVVV